MANPCNYIFDGQQFDHNAFRAYLADGGLQKLMEERSVTLFPRDANSIKNRMGRVNRDAESFEEHALQFFMGGGRVNSKDFVHFTGFKGTEKKEQGHRLSPKGVSVDQFVHDLEGQYGIHQDNEFEKQQEMIDLMQRYPNREAVLNRLEELNHIDQYGQPRESGNTPVFNPEFSKISTEYANEQLSDKEHEQWQNNDQVHSAILEAEKRIDDKPLSEDAAKQMMDYLGKNMDESGNVNWEKVFSEISSIGKESINWDDNIDHVTIKANETGLSEEPFNLLRTLLKEYDVFSPNEQQPESLQQVNEKVKQHGNEATTKSAGPDQEAAGARPGGNDAQSNEPQAAAGKGQIGNAGRRPDNAQRTESSTGEPGVSIKNTAPRTTEEKLAEVVKQINDLPAKIEAAQQAAEKLRAQGKENSIEHKVKVKVYQQLAQRLKEAEKEHRLLSAKVMADDIRSRKKKLNDKGEADPFAPQMASIVPFTDEDIKRIGVKVYNASLEVAAKALEASAHIREAINQAVDFIQERIHTPWNEEAFKKLLGHDQQFPLNPEEVRLRKVSESPLSDKDTVAADKMLEDIKSDKGTLKDAIEHIKSLPKVSDIRKERIIQYLNEHTEKKVFKKGGKDIATKLLKKFNDDYKKALDELSRNFDTELLAADNDIQKENLKQKYAAAKSYIESEKTTKEVANGDITPVYHVSADPSSEEFSLPQYDFGRRLKQNLQNRYSRLEEAQRHSKSPITELNDAATAAYLKKSKAMNIIDEIRNYLGNAEYKKGSFFDRMKKEGIDIRQFGLWMYAKHAEERNNYNADIRQRIFDAKVLELNQKIADEPAGDKKQQLQDELSKILAQKDPNYVLMPDGGSGMSNEQAQQVLEAAKQDGHDNKYEQFEQEFRANVVDKILDYKHEAGIISDEDYNHLKSYYKNYVPLKVDIEAEEGELNNGKYFSTSGRNGKDLYRSKGAVDRTFEERNNPVLQSIVDLEHAVVKGEENKANVKLANLVNDNPNKAIWEVRPAQYDFIKDKNGKILKAFEVNRPQLAIPFYDAGKKNYIMLYDRGMQQMLKQVGGERLNRIVSYPSRLISGFATLWNPEFLAKNPFFDQQDAYMSLLAQDNKEVVKNFRKYAFNKEGGVFKIVAQFLSGKPDAEWNKWAEDWKQHGGKISFMEQVRLEGGAERSEKVYKSYGKLLSKGEAKHLIRGVEKFATGLEEMTRVMAYRASVEAGIPKEKAAVISRNATVDFEKKGVYGSYINAFKAFANAGTQGLSNMAFLALKSKRVQKFLGFMVLSGMAEAAIGDLNGGCDSGTGEDCYWETPEYRKQRSFLVPMKWFGGEGYAGVPLGRAFGWFNYLGKQTYGIITGKVKADEYIANTIGALMDYYNPAGGTSPIEQQLAGNLGPALGFAHNQNAFGSPIAPDNAKGLKESDNFWPNTPKGYVEASRFLSEKTGGNEEQEGKVEISPNKMEYLVQSAFSGLYSFMKNSVITGEATVNPDEKINPNQIPIAHTFYSESNMAHSKQEYRDLAEKSKKHILTQDDQDNLKKVLDRLQEAGQITDDQWGRRFNYIERNQTNLRNAREKAAHPEEEAAQ